MNRLNMQCKSIPIAVALMFSSSTLACYPPTGVVSAITGAGLIPFETLKASFQTSMVFPTKQLMVANINNMKNVMADSSTQISQMIIESKQQEVFNQIETRRTESDIRNTYDIELQHIKQLSAQSIIDMDGVDGGPAETYFANLCAADKVNKSMFGADALLTELNAVRKTEESLVTATKDIPVAAAARGIQQAHYTKYCSADSVENGICEVKAEIPNADILASVALTPSNDPEKAVLESSVYKTSYTYSDFELEAAKDYYSNILLLNRLPKPRVQGSSVQHDVVARYNQLLSAQQLASYSFNASMSNRTSVDDPSSKRRMSKLDLLNFSLYKAETQDYTAAQNGSDNGAKVYLLASRALGDAIRLETVAYKERIANLQAAYMALRLGRESYVDYINSKK